MKKLLNKLVDWIWANCFIVVPSEKTKATKCFGPDDYEIMG